MIVQVYDLVSKVLQKIDKRIELLQLLPEVPAFTSRVCIQQSTLAVQQTLLTQSSCLQRPLPPRECQAPPQDSLCVFSVSNQGKPRTTAKLTHSNNFDAVSIKSRKSILSMKSRKQKAESEGRPDKGPPAECVCLQQQVAEDREQQQLRTIAVSFDIKKQQTKKLRQKLKLTQRSNQQKLKQSEGKDQNSFATFDYEGAVIISSRPNHQTGGFPKFRYSVDERTDRSEVKNMQVDLSRIISMSRNCTAIKSKESGRVPQAFLLARNLPMPEAKAGQFEKEEEYRRRRVKFSGFRRGVRLPKLYQG